MTEYTNELVVLVESFKKLGCSLEESLLKAESCLELQSKREERKLQRESEERMLQLELQLQREKMNAGNYTFLLIFIRVYLKSFHRI